MNNLIFLILGSASFGFIFAEASGIPQALSKWLLDQFNFGKTLNGYAYVKIPYRLKPFDCGMCLSFWTGFLSSLYLNMGIVEGLLVGFSASLLTLIIKKLL